MAKIDFDWLVEQYYLPLYRFGLSLSHEPSEASDLTQHTFSTWASKGHQLRAPAKVKTWFFTILYREFLAGKRQAARFVDIETDLLFVEPAPVSPALANALAEILDIPIGTVMSRIHRGKAELRAGLVELDAVGKRRAMPAGKEAQYG